MRRGERGASMVEFAIASLVTLLLLFGIIDFSELMYAYHTVANAARQGTRWAAVRGNTCPDSSCPATSSTVQTYVLTQMPLLNTANATVTTTWANTTLCSVASKNASGCTVTVNVSYPFTFDVALLWSHTMTLSSSSTMVISE